uniref:ATPase domain containing protein n=1 Tax=viral metagenome TaxID=1070528 RepID=A0A6M3MA75_9ZZZZ
MLAGAKYILELYDNDEFKPFLIQGAHGWGKTSYANTLIAETYSIQNNGIPDWDMVKKRIGYDPDEVLNQLDSIPMGERWYVYHWDDAGTWLHSLDFQDPFVKAVGKYMQVARTDLACMIFTSISMGDVSSKIRGIRDAIIIDITKEGCDTGHPYRRTAKAYILRKTWKNREWKDYQWEEYFTSHVPDSFYRWYKPKRDYYSKQAKSAARKHWENRKKD